jgi:hypothetical protein
MKLRILLVCLFLLLVAAGSASAQQVVMNEIYSRGVTGNLDWIEIYNRSDVQIDISTYKIYDNGGQSGSKPKKQFPAGAVIPAKGFFVIITDTADYVGDLSKFGLSQGGEKVWLEDGAGTVIDSVLFADMSAMEETYGRGPDGGAWSLLPVITRGSSNGAILMNEIWSVGVTGNKDWIEIYNGVSAAVRIGGYKIYDSGGQSGSKPKKPFPPGTVIPAKGFYVIITDTADYVGDLSGFGLSQSGEKVWLEDSVGTIIDSVAFGAMTATQSWSRIPDGGAWVLANTITRGTTNGTGTGVDDGLEVPSAFMLAQNYPNPFNPSTTIRYALPQRSSVSLAVYNAIGQEVALLVRGEQEAGTHEVKFNASNLSTGVYFYRLTAGSFIQTRRLLLLK